MSVKPQKLGNSVSADNRAAAQLGHGSKEITKKHYIVKPALAPDSSHILEQLGEHRAMGGPDPRTHQKPAA